MTYPRCRNGLEIIVVVALPDHQARTGTHLLRLLEHVTGHGVHEWKHIADIAGPPDGHCHNADI
eukprot:CAMPEP_0115050880 /NCGR_PEP_ID=MMETSP0227-20121206/2028_1 /TAXON_ID=89957 /ORGANISM="Polarella glacialis, Strain CCMP 1383" /LENGTH=63 /DNA_ID=CAMNT_0002434781 /DNA_START=310 /DNA_END=501 /DNA_ORIENTATION=+